MNGPTKVVFDTNVIIKYVNKIPGFIDLETRFAGDERLISIVTKMELLAFPGIDAAEKARVVRFLQIVSIVPLMEAVETEAIEIRRIFRPKLPDCIIAATAIALGATLVTGDGHLFNKKIPGLLIIFVPSLPVKGSWRTRYSRNKSLWVALGCFILSTLVFAILFIIK